MKKPSGEMAERSKAHAWKACVSQGTGGSNPPLSVYSPAGPVLAGSTQLRQVRKEAAVSVVLLSRSKLAGVFLFENSDPSHTNRKSSEDFDFFGRRYRSLFSKLLRQGREKIPNSDGCFVVAADVLLHHGSCAVSAIFIKSHIDTVPNIMYNSTIWHMK